MAGGLASVRHARQVLCISCALWIRGQKWEFQLSMSQSKSRSSSANGVNTSDAPTNGAPKPAAKVPALAKAVSLHLEGNLQEALEEINGALAAGEESLEIFSAKAQLQYDLEQYEDAEKSYAKVLSLHPKHAAANFHMAVCLEKLGRWQEAADFFEKAAETDPDRLDTRLGLGICQLHLDKTEAAAERFDRVLSQDPE